MHTEKVCNNLKGVFLMNKERQVIEPNAIIIFDGDVNSIELEKLPKGFQGDIVIKGMLVFEENLSIECDNLYVDVLCGGESDTYIKGNVFTSGDAYLHNTVINGSLYCKGNLCSTESNIAIGEDLVVREQIEAFLANISVGGNLKCNSIKEANSIEVLGEFEVTETVNANHIHIYVG